MKWFFFCVARALLVGFLMSGTINLSGKERLNITLPGWLSIFLCTRKKTNLLAVVWQGTFIVLSICMIILYGIRAIKIDIAAKLIDSIFVALFLFLGIILGFWRSRKGGIIMTFLFIAYILIIFFSALFL